MSYNKLIFETNGDGVVNLNIKTFKAAFPLTVPVLAGFSFLGLAYGVLMTSVGLGIGWTFLMSTLVFAGSMQYVALTIFAATFNPFAALVITLTVNARHLFYGLSILDRLKEAGKYRFYIVFALCDEAFSLIYANEPPEGVAPGPFMFAITFLCQAYWVIASVAGAYLGKLIKFNSAGLEFALTAMFLVTFLNQWEDHKNRTSSLVGLGSALVALIIFGPNQFIIPAMIAIVITLALLTRKTAEGVHVNDNPSL